MSTQEFEYIDALKKVRDLGSEEADRTGTGVIAYPGISMRFDLSKGFPAVTTKKLAFNAMLVELLWFLKGDTNIKWLKDRKCNIWNEWADQDGDLGPVYGAQWRKRDNNNGEDEHGIIDQIRGAINRIKMEPHSRRIIVDSWNVGRLDSMALPPCHCFFQFSVIGDKLNLHLTQRSGDMFLGVPFNIASYALLLELISRECKLKAGELIHTVNHAHIYSNHQAQVETQLNRSPLDAPSLFINESIFANGLLNWIDNDVDGLSLDEIKGLISLQNYECHPAIKAPVAV